MRIIGFGQQMMLDGESRIQHEITVEVAGVRHIVPTDEKTVQKLIELFSGNRQNGMSMGASVAPSPRVRAQHLPVPDAYDEEPAEQVTAETFGGDYEDDPGEIPVRPVPKFLDEDEDGQQV